VGMLDLIGGEQWMADSLVARGGCGVWDGIFLLVVSGARWSWVSACCVMFSLIPFGGFNLLSSFLLCQSFPRAIISSLGCARVHVCALLRSQLQLSGSMTCMVAVGDSSSARDQDLDKRHHTTFVRSSFFQISFSGLPS